MTLTTDPNHVIYQHRITRSMVEHLEFKELCKMLDELHLAVETIMDKHQRKER